MGETKGKLNGYTCQGCGFRIVTVNLHAAVTPFMVGCQNPAPSEEEQKRADVLIEQRGYRMSGGCGASMESHFYQVPQDLAPSHEWYSPDQAERKRMRRKGNANLRHVEDGGLLLRPVPELRALFSVAKLAETPPKPRRGARVFPPWASRVRAHRGGRR